MVPALGQGVSGHIRKAILIPLSELTERAAEPKAEAFSRRACGVAGVGHADLVVCHAVLLSKSRAD